MRRGGNLGDTYSRATLFACSNIPLTLFTLNSPLTSILKFTRLSHPAMCMLRPCFHPSSPRPFSGDFVPTLNLTYSIFLPYDLPPILYGLQE